MLCVARFLLTVFQTMNVYFLFFAVSCNVILIAVTEGGTLSKPIADLPMQLRVWTSTSSERFIDCSLQVLCPALDSLFDVDCYSGAAALHRLGVLMLQWLNFTVVPALFISHDDLFMIIYLLHNTNQCVFEYQHICSRDNNRVEEMNACVPVFHSFC